MVFWGSTSLPERDHKFEFLANPMQNVRRKASQNGLVFAEKFCLNFHWFGCDFGVFWVTIFDEIGWDAFRRAQDGPRRPPGRLKIAPRAPRGGQEAPRSAQGRPKRAPRGVWEPSKRVQKWGKIGFQEGSRLGPLLEPQKVGFWTPKLSIFVLKMVGFWTSNYDFDIPN